MTHWVASGIPLRRMRRGSGTAFGRVAESREMGETVRMGYGRGWFLVMAALAGATLSGACGGDSDNDSSGGGSGGSSGGTGAASGSAGSGATGGSAGTATGGSAGTASGGSAGTGGGFNGAAGCSASPPAGAAQPDPLPTYAGTCPTLQAGANTISSSATDREFLLALPDNPQPGESFPVLFLWHWLGGDAQDFYDTGEVQVAVDTQRFIAVIPEKKGDVAFTWPMEIISSQARVDEELGFFDDMLACVAEQNPINESCVSSIGVSAGALWTAQLAHARSKHLASFVSLSGGVGGVIKPWQTAQHKLPALVLWGGPDDNCAGLLKFQDISHTLEDELTQDGHFFLECIHNCGHTAPPFEGPSGYSAFKGLWDFALDHPYWLQGGTSPYQNGLPADLPQWCGVGKGSAQIRQGACPNPSAC